MLERGGKGVSKGLEVNSNACLWSVHLCVGVNAYALICKLCVCAYVYVCESGAHAGEKDWVNSCDEKGKRAINRRKDEQSEERNIQFNLKPISARSTNTKSSLQADLC